MKETAEYAPREWQARSFRKIDRAFASGRNELVPVNACVGSGKTDLAAYAFGKFMKDNPNSKTVSVFVSPRIRLCKQQTDSLRDFVKRRFGLKEGTDWKILRVDCESDDYSRRNAELNADHAVFVVCDESLWGIDKAAEDCERRWHGWISRMRKWKEEGRLFGAIFYDESHNYEKNQDRMFGKEFV